MCVLCVNKLKPTHHLSFYARETDDQNPLQTRFTKLIQLKWNHNQEKIQPSTQVAN